MERSLPNSLKIAPFLVFYLIHGMQIGSGLLSFQRIIAEHAGYDAWISILIPAILIHIIIVILYKIAEIAQGDLVEAHAFIFGKYVSKLFDLVFIIYFIIAAIMILKSYIAVIQVWVFPELLTIWIIIPFFLLVYYIISGGFRVITGVVFFGVIIPIFIYSTIIFSAKYATFTNLLPIFDHSMKEILYSSYRMSLSFLGYELLLIYYPYIQNAKKSKKWAHLGIFATTALYTFFAIFTFAYFSEGQLQIARWPTLTMWKIIHFPLIERFEYIGIAIWFFMVLPNVCLLIWSSSRIINRTFKFKFKQVLVLILLVCIFLVQIFETGVEIKLLKNIVSNFGAILVYIYFPILLLFMLIKKRVGKQ